MSSNATVDFARLQSDLEEIAAIGRCEEDHGLYRMAFTDAYMESREWLKRKLEAAGLEVKEDEATNVFGRYHCAPERPSIMTGSHLDTVPGGGSLDGALGVVAGLECLRRVQELGLVTSYGLEVGAFADEEGRFGPMLGSQAVCGQLTPESVLSATDLNGERLPEAMARYGYDALQILRARRPYESLRAFVELHIEQGPVLDRANVPIGVVEGIVGLFRWHVRLIGQANHAGTTPMTMRTDAFQGLAEFSLQLPRILEEHGGPNSVATVGRVALSPGVANVVPGTAEFSLEARDVDSDVLAGLGDACRRTLSAIARRRGLRFEFEIFSELAPARCDAGILEEIEASVRDLGARGLRLPSGAAHDTQSFASITRVGMIFVPSAEGRSHHPSEWTAWEDIEMGANVLLNTLIRLSR